MTPQELSRYIANPELLDMAKVEELEVLLERYPHFNAVAVVYLKRIKELDLGRYSSALKRLALSIGDTSKLAKYIEDVTDISSSVAGSELKSIISQPRQSYQLADKGMKPESLTSLATHLVDTYTTDKDRIKRSEQSDDVAEDIEEEEHSEELITETLAKIYLNQGLFREAIASYEKLSLKYPKKNAYFADRVRDIRKLMIK